MTIPILFDTDPGVDDAMALLLALASPELDVLGVTTVFGNSDDMELLTANALSILALAGQTDIPVCAGSALPLTRPYTGRAHLVHGDNCLGGVVLPASPRPAAPTFAAQFMVDACRARPGEITLVAVGPLTNLALALRIEPSLPALVREVSIMGGSARAGGNITPVAEFNIFADAEAARLVFAAGWKITMAGLDVTCSPRIAEPFLDRLASAGNRAGRFLADAFGHYLAFYRSRGFAGACMHDVHAVMPLVRPDLYTFEQVCIDVETTGELTRGQTVADWRGLWNRPAQTRLLTGVDEQAFLDEFAARVARLP